MWHIFHLATRYRSPGQHRQWRIIACIHPKSGASKWTWNGMEHMPVFRLKVKFCMPYHLSSGSVVVVDVKKAVGDINVHCRVIYPRPEDQNK